MTTGPENLAHRLAKLHTGSQLPDSVTESPFSGASVSSSEPTLPDATFTQESTDAPIVEQPSTKPNTHVKKK